MSVVENIAKYQLVSTPLLAVSTHDIVEFIDKVVDYYKRNNICLRIGNENVEPDIWLWSPIEGIYSLKQNMVIDDSVGGRNLLNALQKLLENNHPVLFIAPLVNELLKAPTIQTILLNIRERMKNGSTVVLVDSSANLPASLQSMCIPLQDEFPKENVLKDIASKYIKEYNKVLKPPSSIKRSTPEDTNEVWASTIAKTLRGLSAFAAEQIIASTIRDNLNQEKLWNMKCAFIGQLKGIDIGISNNGFSKIGGLHNIKEFSTRIIKGKNPPDAIVWVDEIEKMIAGSEGSHSDNTGVSQGILQTLLTYMQEQDCRGMIFLGPPGTGKSAMAKAIGDEAKKPTITLDIGAMKSSLVGSTENNIRQALNTVKHVAPKQLWIATCNSITTVPMALRRRFTYGIWFFDLPTEEERIKIWEYYKYVFDVSSPPPKDEGWTGAEIRTACQLASDLTLSLTEASSYIVPVSTSLSDEINKLRTMANNKFNSASYPGPYRSPPQSSSVRAVNFG